MRLNNDCIRDILLYVEDNTDLEKSVIDIDKLSEALSNKYNENALYYHIKMISQADLVDNVFFAEDRPYTISSLSWEGHQYLDNIRDEKVWNILKDKTKDLSSVSLKILIPVASKIIENMLLH